MTMSQQHKYASNYERQHVHAAMAAMVVSLLLHAGLVIFFPRIRWQVAAWYDTAEKAVAKPFMKVDRVELPAEPVAEPVADTIGNHAKGTGDVPGLGGDLAEESRQSELPPPESLAQPGESSEDWLAGENGAATMPEAPVVRMPWDARKEIIEIQDRSAAERMSLLPRKTIPRIDRSQVASDITCPINAGEIADVAGKPNATTWDQVPLPGNAEGLPDRMAGDRFDRPVDLSLLLGKRPGGDGRKPRSMGAGGYPDGIGTLRSIENLLKINVTTYTPLLDRDYGYFRLEIARAGASVLPVLPKDVLLVQDCSNSMASQRLHFCRTGMVQCIEGLLPDDRFNLVRFRERADFCFADWAANTVEKRNEAKPFIEGMLPGGDTDIFASLLRLLDAHQTPGRPVIALVVTDGYATRGVTRNSDIIGEFSRVNDGSLSVFTVSAMQTPDTCLLDLISYCNRGDVSLLKGGRWSIPEFMVAQLKEVSRPVLADLRFRFDSASHCEVYPVLTENLYLDKPLVLWGRYPRATRRFVMQAVGQAQAAKCDMVFDVNLDKADSSSDKTIRRTWAQQKIYHLMGQYARQKNPQLLHDMDETARKYRVRAPYAKQL